MNAFIRREDSQSIGALHRDFIFDGSCAYGAIHSGSSQVAAIDKLNQDFGKAVYYLLYTPISFPCPSPIRFGHEPRSINPRLAVAYSTPTRSIGR